MLKLEKVGRSKEVQVTVRGKEPFWNRVFLFAFLVAFVIHAGGYFLFTIAPIKWHWDQTSALPIKVEAIFAPDAMAIAMDDAEHLPVRYVPPPEGTVFAIPELRTPRTLSSVQLLANREGSFPFSSLEEALLDNFPDPFLAAPPVKIAFFGPLAQIPLLEDGLENWRAPVARSLKGFYRTELAVMVEEMTGQIIWHNILQSSGVPLLDREAVRLLYLARFAPRTHLNPFMAKGSVEITFFMRDAHD